MFELTTLIRNADCYICKYPKSRCDQRTQKPGSLFLQALGASNSAYSLASQLSLNPVFSSPERAANMEDVEALMQRLRDEYGILSLSDIVLNHTANETPWLAGQFYCEFMSARLKSPMKESTFSTPFTKVMYTIDFYLLNFTGLDRTAIFHLSKNAKSIH
jgi:hypothetical protein